MDVSYLLDSNDKQREAVAASRTNMLVVLAGAGSGGAARSGTPIHRLAAERGELFPYSIMAVTFYQQLAADASPYRPAMGTTQGGMWVGTFHGLAHRFARTIWMPTCRMGLSNPRRRRPAASAGKPF
ncbi:UvrD-helicase domain-containing protein [Klebsiella pneumoniae]|uniref:UvrD-helicase domain-containing protein n=1 Tax=Klebsiella pneumoniae TaxID=573 RepID=UPI00388FC045